MKAMAETSGMATIEDFAKDPLDMFKCLLNRLDNDKFITMNLATLDREFGVLNRTVVYRGLIDDSITYITERNIRGYKNLKDNPKLGLTLLFPEIHAPNGAVELWQVRLIDAVAEECNEQQIASFWAKENLFAKIRSHICECGKPVDHDQLKLKHNQLLDDYRSGRNKLEQTETYTAFKIIPKRWDFYKTETDQISDRLQYRKKEDKEGSADDQWDIMHVAA